MNTKILKIIGYLFMAANLGFLIADIILDKGIVCEVVNGGAVIALIAVFLLPEQVAWADRKIADFYRKFKKFVKC